MARLSDALRSRMLAVLLGVLAVAVIVGGAITLGGPPAADSLARPTPAPVAEIVSPSPATSLAPSPTASPSPVPSPSLEPSPSPSPSLEATPPAPAPEPTRTPTGREHATRVVMPALGIDMPVIRGNDSYPYCNVAMYLSTSSRASQDLFGQPKDTKVTYLYGHARKGMFGPIYDLAIARHTPKKMVGMTVRVYTSYNRLFTYTVYQVRLHITSLDAAIARRRQEVWLQTSEGPKGTKGKTQVLARLRSVEKSTQQESQPKARPVRCG
jgi:Sortase domain